MGSIHIQLRKGILYFSRELWDTLYYKTFGTSCCPRLYMGVQMNNHHSFLLFQMLEASSRGNTNGSSSNSAPAVKSE